MNPPIFDHKLWHDAQFKPTGANIHTVNNKMTVYRGQFDLVEQYGKSWDDMMPSGQSRAELVSQTEIELRKLLTQSANNARMAL
jgi:hypothetical protein